MERDFAFPRGLLEEIPDQKEEKDIVPAAPIIPARSVADKLANTWRIYSNLVQDQRLWDIINEPHDEDSDFFYLQKTIVHAADQLGRTLSGTRMVTEDLQYLFDLENKCPTQ